MKSESIEEKLKYKDLIKKSPDKPQAKSLIESSENNANEILKINLSESNSQIIFRKIYESIRQLGDACWNIPSYVLQNHEVSLDAIK